MKRFIIWAVALSSLAIAQDYTCSSSKPCKEGCCGNSGYCGFGPSYCGSGNCTSSCNAKSECDPGWGSQWSSAETCPLNVCCSQYGFCGTTSEFCGTKTVQSPSCSGSSANQRVMGYYEGWSVTRQCDQMYPEDLPVSAYTHLNFAFAFVDPNSYHVAPMDAGDVALYSRFTGLKQSNPGLQTWISVGGWSMNDADQPTASTFSNLAASTSAQSAFFSSLIQFMATYGFDGVDIDWEYPVAPERSGNPADFTNYVSFLKNLRAALSSSGHSYGLTITIPSSYWYMQHFDIVNIEPIIDWFNVMTYDLHGTWDSTDPYIGPYVYAHTNLTEIDQTMQLLWRNNINPSKVTMGLGFYGRSFTLSNPSCSSPGCGFSSGGNPGQCTANSGTLSYPEIQNIIAAGGATVTLNQAAAVKQVVWGGNQWVSYDDAQTLGMKQQYANSKCLGGIMVWAASLDSRNGSAAAALSGSTGLQIRATTQGSIGSYDTLDSCVWSECGASCPGGTSPVAGGGSIPQNSNVGIWQTGCSGSTTRSYCCPNSNLPTCTWRGSAPFCNGKCHNGEVQVATDWDGGGHECWTGHKALCCTSNAATAAAGACTWVGSAPFCGSPSCPSGQVALTTDALGSGGDQPCATGHKTFCCTQPSPYTNCNWYGKGGFLGYLTFNCDVNQCPSGQFAVAVDPSWCSNGVNKFCCDVPSSINNPQLAGFKSQLQAFAASPVCGTGALLKRDNSENEQLSALAALVRRYGVDAVRLALERRGTPPLNPTDLDSMLRTLAAIFTGNAQTSLGFAEAQLYSQILQPDWGVGPNDVNGYFQDFPGYDPLLLTYELACSGGNVSHAIQREQAQRNDICVLASDVTSKGCGPIGNTHDEFRRLKRENFEYNLTALDSGRLVTWTDGVQRSRLKLRNISPDDDGSIIGPGQEPSYTALLTAIVNGEFTFQYTNLQQINDFAAQNDYMAGPEDHQQGILELAWLMGTGNNVNNVNANYQEFNHAGDPPDLYAVVHLHVDHILTAGNQHYIGIYAITMFHGQYVRPSSNRVDGNSVGGSTSNRNRRTPLLRCPGYAGARQESEDRYAYPGYNVDQSDILSVFLNQIVQDGILHPSLFNAILGNSEGQCQFFDWTGINGQGSLNQNGGQYQPPQGG